MKQILYSLFVVLSLSSIVTSCQKEVPTELVVEITELMFSKEGGNQQITFSTNKNWTASSSATWAKLSVTSGDSNVKSISVTADANADYDDRTCSITITAEELSKTVNVRQSTNLGLVLSPTNFDLTNAAQEIEVEVKANVQYSVSIDEACKDWISLANTKALASNKVVFIIAANETYDNREGRITIQQTDGTLMESITVKQGQTNGLFISTPDYELSNTSHDLTVEVKSNVEYEVVSNAEWIKYETKSTKSLTPTNISLHVEENHTYDERVGTVSVKQKDGELTGTITIKQAENLGLFVSPESVEISKDAQEVEVEVQYNVDFDVIVPEEAKGTMITSIRYDGDGVTKALEARKYHLKVAENKLYQKRETTITFKQKEGALCGTIILPDFNTGA